MVIVKKIKDEKTAVNPYCGEVTSLLTGMDFPQLSVALAFDIKPTIAHFHKIFVEIYFLLDGSLTMEFADPATNKIWQQELSGNELCLIGTGIHHRIIKASDKNRLCVIASPAWFAEDEYPSNLLK